MNKIFKPFKAMGRGIYKVLDKILITPISKLVYSIGRKLNNESKIEKVLNRPNVMIYLSLIFALIAFYCIDSKAVTLVQTEAEVLTNQPVTVKYNSSAYVVEGVPETVDITLMGRKSDLYLAKRLGDNEVVLDLSDYEASDTPIKVKLTYNKPINSLTYKLDPSYVTVTIKKKVSSLKTVSHDLLNLDKLDPKLSVKSVELSKNEVVVKGSQDTLDRISSVKALVDLSNSDFTEKGTYTVDNLNLVAYDESGAILDNVEIVATNVSATLVLDSYSQRVPIKVMTTGELEDGSAISSILINGEEDYTITVYGDQEELDKITSVPVTVDISGQGSSGTKTYNVTISKPTGVRYIDETSCTVELKFGEAKQTTIKIASIERRNLGSGLSVNLTEVTEIPVQVIGVQEVIDNIKAEDIKAFVDLTGYTVGETTAVVQIEAEDQRAQYIVTEPVKLIISSNINK